MKRDPIVEEVRKIGTMLSAKCGHDVRRYGKVLMEHEKQSELAGRRIIRKPLSGKRTA